MAMSFARPDPSSPASVADAAFSTGRRGFDQNEVRDFLRMVAAELGRLQERERFLERELREAQSHPAVSAAELDDETVTRLLGEETARVLSAARESAAEIRSKAEEAAAQLLREASEEAARLREEADLEASRRRTDARADAEAEVEMAKQQGREMVNEARAYRERVLAELARRRELAREQIEQLIQGRDRLMQSFERARLVAVDVVAELQPLGEPDEYVDLRPTTGPVPVMVPNAGRQPPVAAAPADTADRADADADGEPDVEEARAPDGDDAVEEAGAPDGDVEDAAGEVEGFEDAAEEVEGVEDAAGEVEGVEDAAGAVAGADDDGEDVVVDLFARIRAGVEAGRDAGDAADADTAGREHEPLIVLGEDPLDIEGRVPDTVEAATSSDAADRPGDGSEPVAGEAAADTDAPSAFERRDEDLTPLIVASARTLRRVLADEQNEVLDALRRSEPAESLDLLLPWASEHVGRYTEAIADDLLVAAHAGAASVTDGKVAKLRSKDAKDAVAKAGAVLEEYVIGPLRERLARAVADGDGDNGAITKPVRAIYREWKTQRIDEHLDDVLRTAHGRGVLAGLEPGTPVSWVTDPSVRACADCDDNVLGGVLEAGAEFPTGHVFAPAHPGCRCLLQPAGR